MKPLAVTMGDPAGIGPEIALRAARAGGVREAARVLLIGPEQLRPDDVARFEEGEQQGIAWRSSPVQGAWTLGSASAAGGHAALGALRVGHELALAGRVEALVTAPVSKEALHLAGERVEGQTELLGRWCGAGDPQMIAVVGELRVMLLTRHVALREALAAVTRERVGAQLLAASRALEELGLARPRIALAGLNPHASEGGLFGDEEARVLEPALADARAAGVDASGPYPPDSIFLRASKGEFDGVLALYHDQAFIPVKLIGEGRALTVLAGLPYLRVSPAHGVAFDLAGSGRARADDLIEALLQAARWALARRERGAAAHARPGGRTRIEEEP